ncbi:hypothetical protein HY229_05455 [Candidatus Acetothermia bacterium]|nr:hypothetical protein [Candidatus Acetothermia bacterium]MBI3643531.1 hypothetical protein [Candidatus Acetothermia bacterium]
MGLEIREIHLLDEIHRCEELQQQVWGFSDISVIPHHLIRTTIDSGGLLLGAFQNGQMIGFTFSFPGYIIESGPSKLRLKHCSIMAAVLPEFRFQGIGYQLKLKQREALLAQGIELISWTFDPLQSSNAHFNFQKLGIICRSYQEDYYGDIRDQLNRGLPTDRFEIEWWLKSPRVSSRIKVGSKPESIHNLQVINKTELENGILSNVDVKLDLKEKRLLAEIPRKIAEIDADGALQWRLELRSIIQTYFQQGYIVSELLESEDTGAPRSFYLLEKISLKELLTRT